MLVIDRERCVAFLLGLAAPKKRNGWWVGGWVGENYGISPRQQLGCVRQRVPIYRLSLLLLCYSILPVSDLESTHRWEHLHLANNHLLEPKPPFNIYFDLPQTPDQTLFNY